MEAKDLKEKALAHESLRMKKWTPGIEPHNPGLSDPRDTNKPPTAARARPSAETYTRQTGRTR
jgi:hypothetical protein